MKPPLCLPKPSDDDIVQLPPRRAIRAGHTDVLVVGGGPAGIGAALGAAAAGASVVLAERYGFVGGNATAALVAPLTSYHRELAAAVRGDDTRMLPTDHGDGEPIIDGALRTLLDRLDATGGSLPAGPDTGFTTPFDPELFKLAGYQVLADAGVRVLLHAFASDLMVASDLARVVFETKSGAVVLDADVVVDCTGDGDLAAAAGAAYEVGRPSDGLTQPMTLSSGWGASTTARSRGTSVSAPTSGVACTACGTWCGRRPSPVSWTCRARTS
jgi:NADPH-dependent 2,4-dienoyl-CoA reductase/sulfur reductase-like enzyme